MHIFSITVIVGKKCIILETDSLPCAYWGADLCDFLSHTAPGHYQVCLVTYKNSGTAVTGFADISKAKNMALADGTVPVGQYTRAALVNSKMVEGDASKPQAISDSDISKALEGLEINSCANVGAVASAVAEGANEIGTVYYSDTFGYENQLDIIEKLPNSLTGDVIYPIAALKGDSTTSDELEAAKEFIAYLQTDEAMSVFEKYHFSVNK